MTTGRDIEARLREEFPGLPPDALRWLSEHPETIQWPEDVARRKAIEGERAAEGAAFWAWVDKTYTPSQIQSIQSEDYDYTSIWEHYILRIAGTQWDVGFQPLIRQPEDFGLTPADWRNLTGLMRDETGLQAQLQALIDTGRIDQSQAAEIWNSFREQALVDSRAIASAQRRTSFALAATGGLEDPEDRARRLERETRAEDEARKLKEREVMLRSIRQTGVGITGAERAFRPTPFTEFGTAEEFRAGFDIPQTERAINWFRSRFPRLIEQFKFTVPKGEQKAKTFTEFLEGERPKVKEEFFRQTPFQRGERPSVFQPRITTVRF